MSMEDELSNLYGDLEKFLIPKLTTEQKEKKIQCGEYEHIGYSLKSFVEQLKGAQLQWLNDHRDEDELRRELFRESKGDQAQPETRASFIDIGCGIGTKLLVATKMLYRANITGIEITPEYVEVARRLVPNAHIIQGDALEADYSTYDIIYFYCPLADRKKEKELEARIITSAKSGAYILPAGYSFYLPPEQKAMIKYMGWGYQKR